MNGIELAKNIALEVNEKVKRTYWTNEQIDKWFGRRSAKEILDNGTTCFMNPCPDLTFVSAYLMSSNNIEHNIVIEEHLPTKEFPFNRLHFALEFQDKDKKYSLNYKKCNEVHISGGNYNGREDIPQAGIIRISGADINPYKPIHENLGYNTLEGLIKDKFIGFSLEKNLDRLKQDNSEENYRFYKKRYGENFNFITKFQNLPSL
jgi:hypothetical protein